MAETVKNATVHNTKGDLFTSFNVDDFDIPHGKDEVWRFVHLRRLNGLHNGTFPAQTAENVEITGTSSEKISKTDPRVGRSAAPVDRVGAQAFTSAQEAHYVKFAAGTVTNEPVQITTTGAGAGHTTFAHIVVEVEEGAEAVVNLHYQGNGTHADNVEFVIGDNAKLTVITDASWDDDAIHLSGHTAVLGRDSTLRHSVALFGGSVVRIIPRVRFTGPGGDAELLGVYFADDGQFFEQRLLVDHAVPNCRSNVLYKGALQADPSSKKPEARTAWVGDVLIRANAQGTDTYEANRNLVLTEGAYSMGGDVAPVGELVEIAHRHGALVVVDIPPEEARRLIVRGFFSEVIGRIPVAAIREDLENRVAAELEALQQHA